jgi:tRNA pseudouridine38-40 synthase
VHELGLKPISCTTCVVSQSETDSVSGVVRLRLLVAYHGAGFHGLAPQPGQRTVVGLIGEAVATVLRLPEVPEFTMSGRTDAGVHAWGQVLHVDVPDGADPVRVERSLRKMLSPEVVVRSVHIVDDTFDARFSATWRRYRYSILNDPVPDPWLADTAWHVGQPLNVDLMRLAIDPFIGEHDFSSFCGAVQHEGQTNRRRILQGSIRRVDDDPRVLVFELLGTAFCRQMVRSVTGFVVDVGRGRRTPGEVLGVLAARDRSAAGTVAPPHGLCLWEVGYD